MDGVDKGLLAKMPLAEAVLTIWRHVASEDRLQSIFEKHRGRCYEQSLSFPTMVQLVSDALLQHQGSGSQSFSRAKETGDLEATTRAVYSKLGRLPIGLSVGWFAQLSSALEELFPCEARRVLPQSVAGYTIVTLDGKTIKQVTKRLKPLRKTTGGVLGGKALVAINQATGLTIAMAAEADGDAHDARLVPNLLPQVREQTEGDCLWVADRAFCDPLQISRFAEANDAFVLRYNAKAMLTPDEAIVEGEDEQGRMFTDQRGWLGREKNKHRCYVRRITLFREEADAISILTNLLDAPAEELLALYRERWAIERMFQQVTEVFGLQRLIGGRPEATIFQLTFCLLLYSQMQLVRGFVLKHQQLEEANVSIEQLFTDVKRELIAWSVVLGTANLPLRSTKQTIARLDKLLAKQWSNRWIKAIRMPSLPRPRPHKTKTHTSVYRALKALKT